MGITNGQATIQCGMMTVEVERFQPMLETGNCLGFARVTFRTQVGSVTIDNFRLLKSKNNDLWVAPPSHKRGEKFYDDVKIDGDLLKLMSAMVKQAYYDSQGPEGA